MLIRSLALRVPASRLATVVVGIGLGVPLTFVGGTFLHPAGGLLLVYFLFVILIACTRLTLNRLPLEGPRARSSTVRHP